MLKIKKKFFLILSIQILESIMVINFEFFVRKKSYIKLMYSDLIPEYKAMGAIKAYSPQFLLHLPSKMLF